MFIAQSDCDSSECTKIGCSLADVGMCSIAVESDSSSFRTDGHFLLDSNGGLVRYFGVERTVTIGQGIIALRRYSFRWCPNFKVFWSSPDRP
jgi:hypothetical protein